MVVAVVLPLDAQQRLAAVARLVQAATGPAAGESPGPPARLPQAGEENARVAGVEADVGGAGVVVLEQHALPALAAVAGAVDAALLAGTKGPAQHSGIS